MTDPRTQAQRTAADEEQRIRDIVRRELSSTLKNGQPPGLYTSYLWDGMKIVGGGTGTVCYAYSTSVGQTFASSGSTRHVIDFGTDDYVSGSGGTVTTGASWKFTNTGAPAAFLVNVCIHLATFAWAASNRGELGIHLNGGTTPLRYLNAGTGFGDGSGSYIRMLQGTALIPLQTGDYFDVRFLQNTGSTLSLTGTGDQNYVDIFSL